MKRSALSTFAVSVVTVIGITACDVDKVEDGRMPSVDVDVEGGKLPKYDVDVADIDVGMKEKTIEVPDVDIDVDTEEKVIKVPDVDIDMPDDEDVPDDRDQ